MQVERVAGQMIAVSPLRILCNDPVKSSCGILSCRPCKKPDVHFAAICRSLASIRVWANETIKFLLRPHNDSGGVARQLLHTHICVTPGVPPVSHHNPPATAYATVAADPFASTTALPLWM